MLERSSPTRGTLTTILVGLGLLLPFVFLLTLGPQLGERELADHCATNMYFEEPFGFTLNCDSWDFMAAAREPGVLLKPEHRRQSRPGLPVLAHLLAQPIRGLFAAASWIGMPVDLLALREVRAGGWVRRVNLQQLAAEWDRLRSEYLAYVLLNLTFLVLAFVAFRLAVGRGGAVVLGVGALLFYNDLVKAFVLSPHTQVVMLLAGTLCALGFRSGIRDGFARPRRIFGLAFLSGLSLTVLPLFLLPGLCWATAALLAWMRQSPDRRPSGRSVSYRLGVGAALVILPYAVWYVVVLAKVGSFYSWETEEYDQVSWLLRGIVSDPLGTVSRLFDHVDFFLAETVRQGGVAIAMALLAASANTLLSGDRGATLARDRAVALEGVGLSLLVVLFFACVGHVVPRLAAPAVPPLIVMAARLLVSTTEALGQARGRVLCAGVACVVLAVAAHTLWKDGPYT